MVDILTSLESEYHAKVAGRYPFKPFVAGRIFPCQLAEVSRPGGTVSHRERTRSRRFRYHLSTTIGLHEKWFMSRWTLHSTIDNRLCYGNLSGERKDACRFSVPFLSLVLFSQGPLGFSCASGFCCIMIIIQLLVGQSDRWS